VQPFDGPVLWIAGSESRYIKAEDAGPMRELFPRVRQLSVKGASHWVHSDAPEVVVEALRRFVAAGARSA
jgi:pimeloyl-ACP methyl ester carboxylesterase